MIINLNCIEKVREALLYCQCCFMEKLNSCSKEFFDEGKNLSKEFFDDFKKNLIQYFVLVDELSIAVRFK